MGRKKQGERWSEAEARALLGEWECSAETLTAFARERGYVPERLRRWQKKLEGKASSKARLVPVEIAAPAAVSVTSGTPSGDRRVEIAVGEDLRVVVPEPLDVEWIVRLVVELRAAGC